MTDPIPFEAGDRSAKPPERRSTPPRRPPVWPRVLVFLFAAVCLIEAALFPKGHPWQGAWRCGELIFPVLACLAAGVSLSHRLALQNQAAIGVIILLFASALELCTSVSSVPFGQVKFTPSAGPMLFQKVPVWLPLLWVAILMTSRETARLILHLRRRGHFYGYWLVGVAALLTVVVALSLEPYGSEVKHYWIRGTPGRMAQWYGVPWAGFVGWVGCGALVLAFSTPWFINKRPTHPPPRLRPVLVWGVLNLYLVAGNATKQLWPAVIAGAVLAALATCLAWLGARKHRLATPS